jgi:hypothetical protein
MIRYGILALSEMSSRLLGMRFGAGGELVLAWALAGK